MKIVRQLAKLLLVLALLVLAVIRIKLEFVPAGAKPYAFLTASTKEQSSTSPTGKKLYYRFNDAGAAHSGLHDTWCYRKHLLFGKRVIVGGWSTPAVRKGEEPLEVHWHEDGRSFSVRFSAGRHDRTPTWISEEMK